MVNAIEKRNSIIIADYKKIVLQYKGIFMAGNRLKMQNGKSKAFEEQQNKNNAKKIRNDKKTNNNNNDTTIIIIIITKTTKKNKESKNTTV